MNLAITILQLIGMIGPSVIQASENLFSHQPNSGPAKAQAALQMAQAGIIAAIGLAPSAFGPPENILIKALNDAMVNYYNNKGWPVTAPPTLPK